MIGCGVIVWCGVTGWGCEIELDGVDVMVLCDVCSGLLWLCDGGVRLMWMGWCDGVMVEWGRCGWGGVIV